MGRAAMEMKWSREKYLSWKIMLRKSSFFWENSCPENVAFPKK